VRDGRIWGFCCCWFTQLVLKTAAGLDVSTKRCSRLARTLVWAFWRPQREWDSCALASNLE
jgi:hypothetical protein